MSTQRDHPLRLGALIGGGGRTVVNLADHIDRGALDAEIAVVVSPRPKIKGVQRARDRGLDVRTVENEADIDQAITKILRDCGVELVCLAGYLRHFCYEADFEGRIINIHPALLPRFGGPGMYGMRVHRAVLQGGGPISGCTVHFVDEEYDHGPIILQKACLIHKDDTPDTLAARVFQLECRAFPEAVALISSNRVTVDGKRVSILSA